MNEVAPALAQRWKGEVRPACLSRRLGSERWFLTQTQLSNTAGRTVSLLLSLKLMPSKIIIIPFALPAEEPPILAQGLQRRGGEWGQAEGRASGVFLVRE